VAQEGVVHHQLQRPDGGLATSSVENDLADLTKPREGDLF
jgi:hypothetical protein